MPDKLVKILNSDLPKLRDIFKKDWPKNFFGFETIDNYYQWFNKYPNKFIDVHIYSLNGDWNDGTYLIFVRILDQNNVLINTCSNDHDKISRLLSLIDWSKQWNIFAYKEDFLNVFQNFFETNNVKIKRNVETIWYYLPKEEALKYNISIPKGFTIKQLTEENIEIINKLWPYVKEGTEIFLKRLICNPSAGLFTDTGELIAWILRTQIGTLGILHVVDEYKRRGLGSLIVKSLAKTVAEMGHDISVTIVTNNTPSIKMFEKLGFKPFTKIYWSDMK